MKYRFSVIIEKDKDGYFALCPELQGCYTQGDTYEEIIKNIREVIKLHIEDRRENKEDISCPEMINLTSMEITV